jgi:hypothetical protein
MLSVMRDDDRLQASEIVIVLVAGLLFCVWLVSLLSSLNPAINIYFDFSLRTFLSYLLFFSLPVLFFEFINGKTQAKETSWGRYSLYALLGPFPALPIVIYCENGVPPTPSTLYTTVIVVSSVCFLGLSLSLRHTLLSLKRRLAYILLSVFCLLFWAGIAPVAVELGKEALPTLSR